MGYKNNINKIYDDFESTKNKSNFLMPKKSFEVEEKTEEVKEQEDVKVEETPKTEQNINNTNYIELDKKPEEKLNDNGVIWKHGSVYNCNNLNFRKKPDKLSEVIHTFGAGDDILYAETNDQEWYQIKDKNGVIGYCMSEFIKIEV